MTTAPTHQDTDRDELVRLAGEQTLLKQENATLTAAQQREIQTALNAQRLTALAQLTGIS